MVLRPSPILFRYVSEFTYSASTDKTWRTAQETQHFLTLSYTASCQAVQNHGHEAVMPHSSEACTHLCIFNINGGFFTSGVSICSKTAWDYL